jgi:Ca-activated chloride channel family protein
MEFQNPYLALLGILTIIFWSIDYWKLQGSKQLVLPYINISKKISMTRFVLFLLGLTAWSLLTFSLVGPRKALKQIPDTIEVNDIFVVFDVSRSMLADDIPPNRLEVAKSKLREFAAMRPKDRIGVIMFSEKVFTLLPLTTDPELVDKMIGEISIGFLGSGTNIGDALGLAVARAEASEAKNKVILLLTDGVSNVESITPMQAAQMAKERGIKIYSVGIGTDGDARIPLGNGIFGKQYQTIPGGSIDMKNLQEISELTGGKSYHASDEGSLEEILSEVNELERTEIKGQNKVIYDELYYKYLLWGILALLMYELIRRKIVRDIL